MYFSKYNIHGKIKDRENYYILNLLTKNADILTKDTYNNIINNSFIQKDFIDKGYFIDEEKEKQLYQMKYLDFIDSRDNDETQIFFVLTYSCNFNCSYCYQSQYNQFKNKLSKDIIDAFFNYVKNEFNDKKKYITLFGGEPLLPDNSTYENIDYIIKKANEQKLELAIVTNGFHLLDYIDLLKNAKIREIQVTLDGTEEVHNKRRQLKNNDFTFNKIVDGIDASLSNNFPVNLRIVLDKENINNLPDLALFANNKGWTKNKLFKTQIGRNYELHSCQDKNKLFSRIELYNAINKLLQDHPSILEFHKPSFSIVKFLRENGKLPSPLYDSCPGCKTEWAFDFNGDIYSCTATVGKTDEKLGTFYPEISKNTTKIEKWITRDILEIEECKNCNLQLACGGGCASVAKNKTGKLHSPDCRPIKELISLGIPLYFNEELKDVK